MSLDELRAALEEHAQTCSAPSDAFSAGLWCETAGGLLLVADGLLGRVEAAEAERDALRKKLEWVVGLFEQAISELPVEESAYQGDDFFAIPRAIDLVLTLRYELPGLRAVVAASVPSGPAAAGPTTSKETR